MVWPHYLLLTTDYIKTDEMFVISCTYYQHRIVRPVFQESLPFWQILRSKLHMLWAAYIKEATGQWTQELREASAWQPARNWSPQSYIHTEMSSANNLDKLESESPRLNWDHSPAPNFDCHLVKKNCSWGFNYVRSQILSYINSVIINVVLSW